VTTAAIYLRISHDARERGEGVERQRQDCLRLAERLGYEIRPEHVFSDNDVSASTASRKPRPAYEAMMAAARAGEVGAVLAYSNSRLTRRLREYLDLIDLHRETGVLIKTCVSGDADLSTADGRYVAMILASNDQAEAERTSERIRRQKADQAARGIPQSGGYRLYGFTRDWQQIPAEAEVIRDLFERRNAGHSYTSLARSLEERGLTTSAGGPWHAPKVARTLANPLMAGLLSHRGRIIGKAVVEPVVDEALWRLVNSERLKGGPTKNARKWLLSGLLRCSLCGVGFAGGDRHMGYRCNRFAGGCGRLAISIDHTDDVIVSLVLARDASRVPAKRPVEPGLLGAIDLKIKGVRAAFLSGDLALSDMTVLLKDLYAQRREPNPWSVRLPAAARHITDAGWDGLDLSVRRSIIGCHLDHVLVRPSVKRRTGPHYDCQRLTVRWHDGSEQVVTEQFMAAIPRRHSGQPVAEPRRRPSPPDT
jgi:site-specific DNA recombinase